MSPVFNLAFFSFRYHQRSNREVGSLELVSRVLPQDGHALGRDVVGRSDSLCPHNAPRLQSSVRDVCLLS
jgi:hypothetical protein